MPLPDYPRVQFRAGEMLPALQARADVESEAAIAAVAQRDLTRYYDLLRRSLPTFTEPEASLLMDACNGWHIEPHTAPLLWAQIADSLADGLAEKWGVDGPALVARLRALSYAQALAICDAVEVAWRSGLPTGEALRRVGLVR